MPRYMPMFLALAFQVAAALCAIGSVSATTLVEPGRTSGKLNFTGCISDASCNTSLNCAANCDGLSENHANARIVDGSLSAGRHFALSSLYTDFRVSSSPETADNLIPCTIHYDVEWKGGWEIFGVFTADKKAEMFIVFFLTDETAGGTKVITKTVRSTEPNSIAVADLSAGAWVDQGRLRDSFTALVQRGHTYRIRFTMRIETLALANGFYTLDYATGAWGATWHDLRVALAADPADLLAEVNARIDTLEHRLENHGHTYLTGRGAGHNNVEATTGATIFFDDAPPGSEEKLEQALREDREGAPRSVLHSNYPNPLDPETTISFSLAAPAPVRIELFDAAGRKVRTLADGPRAAGVHEVRFDAAGLSAGVYFYRLTAGAEVETRKLVVAR